MIAVSAAFVFGYELGWNDHIRAIGRGAGTSFSM